MSRNRLTTTSRFPGLGELPLRTTFGTLRNFKYNAAIIALLRFTVTFDRAAESTARRREHILAYDARREVGGIRPARCKECRNPSLKLIASSSSTPSNGLRPSFFLLPPT